MVTKLSTSPNECHYTHYLVKRNVCQSVHNRSNASIKRHDKLTGRTAAMYKIFTMLMLELMQCRVKFSLSHVDELSPHIFPSVL